MSQAMSMMVQGQSAASMSQATMTVVPGPSQYGKTKFVNDLMLEGGRLALGTAVRRAARSTQWCGRL